MANGLDFFFFLNIKIGALFCVTEYICDHVRNSFNMFKNRTCVVFKVSDIWTANHKTMNRYEITISNTHTHSQYVNGIVMRCNFHTNKCVSLSFLREPKRK